MVSPNHASNSDTRESQQEAVVSPKRLTSEWRTRIKPTHELHSETEEMHESAVPTGSPRPVSLSVQDSWLELAVTVLQAQETALVDEARSHVATNEGFETPDEGTVEHRLYREAYELYVHVVRVRSELEYLAGRGETDADVVDGTVRLPEGDAECVGEYIAAVAATVFQHGHDALPGHAPPAMERKRAGIALDRVADALVQRD